MIENSLVHSDTHNGKTSNWKLPKILGVPKEQDTLQNIIQDDSCNLLEKNQNKRAQSNPKRINVLKAYRFCDSFALTLSPNQGNRTLCDTIGYGD